MALNSLLMLLYYYGLRDSIYAELNVSDRCNPILVPLKFGGENLEAREQLEEVKSNADGGNGPVCRNELRRTLVTPE